MSLPGCMPIQAISYTLHSSSSNNDILMLGKRRIEFTDIKPTFEQYYRPYYMYQVSCCAHWACAGAKT